MYIRRVVAEVDRKEIYILIQRTEETQIIYRSILFRGFAVFDDIERVDKTTAKISIKLVEVKQDADETQKITLLSVDQKASDSTGAFKQEFAISENKFVKQALPRITLGDNTKNNIFVKDAVSGNYDQLVMVQNAEKTFSMNAYSVLGSYNTKNVFMQMDYRSKMLFLSRCP